MSWKPFYMRNGRFFFFAETVFAKLFIRCKNDTKLTNIGIERKHLQFKPIVGASERGNYLYTLGSNSKNPYKKKAVKKKVKNRNKIYKMKQRTNEATFYQWDDSWKGGYRKEISFNVFRHFSNVMNVSARQCKKVFLSSLSNGIDFKWCKNRYTD